MAIEILVDAKRENGQWKLVVNGGHPVEVPQGQGPQTIQWKLTGEAASGTFLAPSGSPPGFQWSKGEPKNPSTGKNIFSNVVRSPNEKQLLAFDENTDSGDHGDWTYKLRARIDNPGARPVERPASAVPQPTADATLAIAPLVADPTIRNT